MQTHQSADISMIEPETKRIQLNGKARKSLIQKFMKKHSGSIEGPSDLSSRRGFSTGVGKLNKTGKAAAIAPTKSSAKRNLL
jgi:hypothetical protein